MAISWESLFASAAVAAVVTVVIDIVIRPRLEVRKDRALRVDREKESLVRDVYLLQVGLQRASTSARFQSAKDILQDARRNRDLISVIRGHVVLIPDLENVVGVLLELALLRAGSFLQCIQRRFRRPSRQRSGRSSVRNSRHQSG